MDLVEKAHYENRFQIAFLKAKGGAFQTLFNELMEWAHGGDYMPCRPWGNRGDRKNDGFLISERRLFQVYAPNEMSEKRAIDKIDEDFAGAKEHWGEHFDTWTFVHNAQDGIPPHVHDWILKLREANPEFRLDVWGFPELLRVFRRLPREDLQTWFGYGPTDRSQAGMGFEEIRVVLKNIGARGVDAGTRIREVPPKKIEANQLSENVAILLRAGMHKASLVDDFFARWHDPTFGERVATAFREKYHSLRENLTPNEVFDELRAWAGGYSEGTAEHATAVYAVIAYYFESCDIFEEPQGDRQ